MIKNNNGKSYSNLSEFIVPHSSCVMFCLFLQEASSPVEFSSEAKAF